MTTTPPSSGRGQSLAAWILGRIDAHGTLGEQLLIVGAVREELRRFLDHPDTLRFARLNSLEVGLENQPVLKFNLMATHRMSPWGLINEWTERIPLLREVGEHVLRHKLKCHAGLKLTEQGVEYELYPCEVAGKPPAADLFARYMPGRAELPAPIHCFGYSSTGSLSAYAEVRDVEKSELEEAIGFPLPASGLQVNALFNSRLLASGKWRTEKGGIEFTPFPSHMLNAVLEHFNLYFSCLLHRGGARQYGIVGMHGQRKVLYTRLFPLPPRKTTPD